VTYTVLAERDRTVRGLFAVEAHPFASAMGVGKTGVFACAACNYRLSFGADWLAVPRCPTRSQCMEALWLVSLTHDLHLDVAVHLGETAVSAETALRNCLESPRGKRQVTLAKPPRFTAWQPSAAHLPAGASSQRCTTECRGGLVAEMNMIAIGRLRYLVVVRGPAAAIRNRRGDIDAILDSFRVLDPGITPDELAELATHGHSGKGVITDNLYRNPRAGLELRGPAGWRPRISAGACMFAIGFTNPQRPGSYLAAEAQGPVGGPWSEIRVGGIIQRRIELAKAAGQKLQVGEWQSRGDLRVIELGVGDGGYGQYAFRPDVLLIINGHACDERDAATLRAAMTSVRSLKRD
jgi:hypothetical protein